METSTKSLTVLVVDDTDIVRQYARRIVERLGHQVIEVARIDEAFCQLAQADIFVFDFQLAPGRTSMELLSAARDQGLDTPAILVTGDGNVADEVREAFNNMVLFKPFTAEDLTLLVEACAFAVEE